FSSVSISRRRSRSRFTAFRIGDLPRALGAAGLRPGAFFAGFFMAGLGLRTGFFATFFAGLAALRAGFLAGFLAGFAALCAGFRAGFCRAAAVAVFRAAFWPAFFPALLLVFFPVFARFVTFFAMAALLLHPGQGSCCRRSRK